jgi:hypothetical protein
VQEGQTLERIARIHGTSVETLLALNPEIANPDRIYAGQTLRVPIARIVIGPPDLSPSTAEAGGPAVPQTPADAPAARSAPKEGLESVLEGAILGDFSDNSTWSKVAGQALGGALPVWGQISDLRDTLAALDKVRKGDEGGWSDLFFATVGWLPVAGDAVKGIARGGRKAATEAAGDDLVKEAADSLLKRTEGTRGVLPTSRIDLGSRGRFVRASEAMSPRAARYQSQVTGRPPGEIFLVDGVKFDGFRDGVLFDAKGPGYASFVKDGRFRRWFAGAGELVDQAGRQVRVAGGVPIVWHVAEPQAARAIRRLLAANGLSGIRVVHTAAKP